MQRHAHHSLKDIARHIGRSALSPAGRIARSTCSRRLAAAESAIHDVPVDRIHLHEVGALDSIIDIVGAVFGMEWLGADEVVVLAAERRQRNGLVRARRVSRCRRPATARLLAGVPIYAGAVRERARHANRRAADDVYATRFGPLPPMRVEQIGYGAGQRDFAQASERAARAGRESGAAAEETERVVVIECEIDDMNPQLFGPLMERLYAAGALDVFYAPVQMKKNRPGTLVTVIAPPEPRKRSRRCCSRESTTIGVRYQESAARASGARGADRRDAGRADPVQGGDAATAACSTRRRSSRTARRRRRARDVDQGCAGAGGRRRGSHWAGSTDWVQGRSPHRWRRFYLTTAIDYVNSRPHLGTAYEKIAADVIARYKRLAGFETRFVMGNDEHSQNVFKKAQEEGLDPLAYCDAHGTGVPQDLGAARRLVRRFHPDDGAATPGGRDGDRAVGSTPPATSTKACTRAGTASAARSSSRRRISSTATARCTRRSTPEWIREKNYFFRLSKYQQPLLDHFAAHPDFIQPEVRRNEILRLIEGGLIDVSVSRAGQSWGIPLPWDPSSVVYVWFDALINYASAVGLGSDRGAVREVVAGRSARDRQGHHPVPRRDLAGDADVRRSCRCRGRCSATDS